MILITAIDNSGLRQLLIGWSGRIPSKQQHNCYHLSAMGPGTEKPPPLLGDFFKIPNSYHTGGSTLVPILQIHVQIPDIPNSSSGYQRVFKILTSSQVEDTQDHGAIRMTAGSLTTTQTKVTVTSFRLLAMGLRR